MPARDGTVLAVATGRQPGAKGEEVEQQGIGISRQPLRILVVDDSDENREALARFLERQGHEVCTAHDGLEGLRAAEEFHPQVLFLDLFMPRMDGFELCARLRAKEELENAAMFALTDCNEGFHRSQLRCVFDAYLGKPIELDVIEGLIRVVTH